MSKKKILKSIISIVLATFMVFAAVVPQQMEAYAADSEFKVELGLAKPTSGNTFSNGIVFKYENATISSANNKQVNTLTISVDKGGINTTSIPNAKSYSDYVESGKKHKMCVWIFENADVTTVQNALRSIEFTYAEGMMVTVVIDGNANSIPDNDDITFTSYDMGSTNINDQLHYYMYVPYPSSGNESKPENQTWSNAYDKAKATTFLGMKGYLATITMLGEDQVLDNLSKDGAWAGGARLFTKKEPITFDTDTWTIGGPNSTTTDTAWYWVCGPEAGKNIPTTWNAKSQYQKSEDSEHGVYAFDVSDLEHTTGYSNWRRGSSAKEPNNYTKGGSTGEWCLQVHYNDNNSQQGSDSPKGWNDFSNNVNKENYGDKIKGYYIEFSEYENSTPSNYNSTLKYTVKDPVNHTHVWTYTADDNEDTITATCGKCTQKPEIKLTTTDAEYTGSGYTGVTITGVDSFTNATGATVTTTYEGRDGTTYNSDTPPTDVGKYTVKVTVTSGTNTYTVNKDFEITPKTVNVTVNNQEVNIGNDISSTKSDITVEGLVGGDALDSVSLVIGDGTGSTTKVTSSTQNNSDISVKNDNGIVIKNGSSVKTGNYTFNVTKGKLTAKKNLLTVTTPPTVSAITYGDTVGTSTITGGVVKDGETAVDGTWSWKSEGANDKPGVDKSNNDTYKWTLVFTPTDSDKYDPIEYATKLTINPKEVSVTWSDDPYTYDGTDHIPTATVKANDLVGGDTCSVTVGVTKSGITGAVDHPKYAGDYTAKATSTNNNYVIKTPDNSKDYSIAKKNITLKAPSDSVAKDSLSTNMTKDKITIDPVLVTGDSLTAATITHKDGDGDYKTVGEHEISIEVSSVKIMNGSDDVTGSYNISVTNGKLTVGKKAPEDANNHKPAVTITYGDKLGDPDVIAQLVSTNGPVMDNGTEVEGHWEWDTDEDPDVNTTMPRVDDTNKIYPVKFVPNDTTNYSVYKTTVRITVNPKPIDVTWNKDSFVYNGKEQIPEPTPKAGDLVGSDTVTFTVDGKKINVGDDYSATITATNNPNYVVKDSSKLKKFKITPTSIDPEVNTKIKITVTYDSNDDPVVHIYDEEAQKELTNGTDFEVNYTSDPNNEYNDVKITGKGNYSGNTTKLVKNIRYQGVIRSIVDLDPSSAEYAPKMNAVPDDKALELVKAKISSNNVNVDASGKILTEEQKALTNAILDDYIGNPDHTSDKGELKADVILTMKELNDAELAKLKDSDPTRKERIETDMQLVQSVMAMPEYKSELEGMTVGGYLDLNLYVRYNIKPAATSTVKEYSTPNIQLYDNLGFDQEVTITIPQKMLPAAGHSRTYKVVRIHYPGGDTTKTPEKDVLPTTRNGNELTFTTGMFSTYAILYRDTLDPVPPKPTPDPDPEPSGDTPAKPPKTPNAVVAPKTADTVDLFVAYGMISAGVLMLIGCLYANKKVNKKYKRE